MVARCGPERSTHRAFGHLQEQERRNRARWAALETELPVDSVM